MSTEQGENVNDLLRQGVAAAKAGQHERARELLMRAVELDEANAAAWMWLSDVVNDLADKEVCLENVLALNPANEAVRRGLAWVRAEKAKMQPEEKQEDALPSFDVRYESPPQHESLELAPPQPEPSLPVPPLVQEPPVAAVPVGLIKEPWDDPVNPFLCPYCAAQAQEQDRECPACGNSLWVRVRRREEHSWWLINVIVAQVFMTLAYAVTPLLLLTYVAFRLLDDFDPFPLLPLYLGLTSDLAPDLADAALNMLPRLLILPFFILSAYTLVMLICTFFRWKPAFYLLLAGAAIRVAVAVAAIALGYSYTMICGGAMLLFTLVTVFIIFQLEDDFMGTDERVYFAIGRKLKGGAALIGQGRSFARQKMWALAVLYLRAGIARLPDRGAGFDSLALAYMRLGRYDLAEKTLQDARHIRPGDPRIAELTQLLSQERARSASEAGS